MKNDFEKKCIQCGNYIFNELAEVIGEDIEYCSNCLEESMRKGEIPPFSDEQLDKITSFFLDEASQKGEFQYESDLNKNKVTIDIYKQKQNEKLGFGKELNQIAEEGKFHPVIGREKEIEETMMILSRKFKSNPLLVGEPGVGKTTVVEGIAQKIVEGDVPDGLKEKRIVEINVGELVSGTKYRGEFEEKITKILKEVAKQKNVILFFDEFHSLMGAGGAEGAVGAVDILKPYITRNEVQIVGATTYEEYRKYISNDGAFSRRMQVVDVKEPDVPETVKIVAGLKELLEAHHKVELPDETILHATKLADRYLTEKQQPDKTIDLLDEAAAFKKITRKQDNEAFVGLEERLSDTIRLKDKFIIEDRFEESKKQLEIEKKIVKEIEQKKEELRKENETNSKVLTNEVNMILERKTGIPVSQLASDNREKIKNLENNLRKKIKGQDEAVKEVSRFIKRSRLNLKDPKRPNGVFLFLGPTGVGKTELSRALSEEMFGSTKSMIQFDMSEFMDKSSANKFIGSPPGYIGYEEGGKLTNQLRRDPYSIVLFDEIEKAHPDIMNMMLQLFEYGRITDNKGKTVDAKNAVFILTSNAGYNANYSNNLGFNFSNDDKTLQKETKEKVLEAVRKDKVFKPEFLNRIDSIVVFNRLSEKAMEEIVGRLTSEFEKRIEKEGYKLSFTNAAKEILKKEGYKPEYGARELKRKIESISDLLTDAILESDRNNYKVTQKDGKLIVI